MPSRSAWIWVAIAAITFATLSRTEAGLQNAKVFSSPVFGFLIKSHASASIPAASHQFLRSASRRGLDVTAISGISPWASMLPVFFVGLLTPLALVTIAFFRFSERTLSAPLLAASFQRPPPVV